MGALYPRAYCTEVCIFDSCLSLQQRCTLESWYLLQQPHTINKLLSVYNQLIYAQAPTTLTYAGMHMHRTCNRTLLLVCIHCITLSFANEAEEDHHTYMVTEMFDNNNLWLVQQLDRSICTTNTSVHVQVFTVASILFTHNCE